MIIISHKCGIDVNFMISVQMFYAFDNNRAYPLMFKPGCWTSQVFSVAL